MVIVVKAREEVKRRYASVDERGVVTAPGSRAAPSRIDAGDSGRRVDVRLERRGGVEAADLDPAPGSADHVEVQHRDRIGQGNERRARIVSRTEQAPLLARERHEDQGPRKARPVGSGGTRNLDQRGDAGGVVVGAVVNLAGALGGGGKAASEADMVVVRAKHHRLLDSRGIRSVKRADNVAHGPAVR